MSDWRLSAKCYGTSDPEMFFPTMADKVAVWKAITFCADCPVSNKCAETGRAEQYGTWGGNPRDKKPLREIYENITPDEMRESAKRYRAERKKNRRITIDAAFGQDEREKYAYRMYKQRGLGNKMIPRQTSRKHSSDNCTTCNVDVSASGCTCGMEKDAES